MRLEYTKYMITTAHTEHKGTFGTRPSAPTREGRRDRQPLPARTTKLRKVGTPASAKPLVYFANCCFNSCAGQSRKDSVRKATVEGQLSSKTGDNPSGYEGPAPPPPLDLSWLSTEGDNWLHEGLSLIHISEPRDA